VGTRRSGERPDDTLASLQAEEAAIEARLAELRRHRALSQDEQVEEQRLKKLKLAMKDRLARLNL
jgi:hypothetical protein